MPHSPLWLVVSALLAGLLGCAPAEPHPDADVRVRVDRVVLDTRSQSPVIILEEVDGERALPIWVGSAEASSIHRRLENLPSPRPNSHDLATRLIDRLDARVEYVVVTRLSRGVFYAHLVLRRAGRLLEIDSRPSDAIAIALRSQAPLFVREAVFDDAAGDTEPPEPGDRAPAATKRTI